MLAVFEELHARSPFVVSTTRGVSMNAQQEHERPIGDPPHEDDRDDEDEDDDENHEEPEDEEEEQD
jgi:hypothetical protein